MNLDRSFPAASAASVTCGSISSCRPARPLEQTTAQVADLAGFHRTAGGRAGRLQPGGTDRADARRGAGLQRAQHRPDSRHLEPGRGAFERGRGDPGDHRRAPGDERRDRLRLSRGGHRTGRDPRHRRRGVQPGSDRRAAPCGSRRRPTTCSPSCAAWRAWSICRWTACSAPPTSWCASIARRSCATASTPIAWRASSRPASRASRPPSSTRSISGSTSRFGCRSSERRDLAAALATSIRARRRPDRAPVHLPGAGGGATRARAQAPQPAALGDDLRQPGGARHRERLGGDGGDRRARSSRRRSDHRGGRAQGDAAQLPRPRDGDGARHAAGLHDPRRPVRVVPRSAADRGRHPDRARRSRHRHRRDRRQHQRAVAHRRPGAARHRGQRRHRQGGYDPAPALRWLSAGSEAILEASRLRLRPILMTSATTVLAMVPMAIGLGSGEQLQRPLAITIIGGLTLTTLLTLFVTPSLYQLAHRIRSRPTGP